MTDVDATPYPDDQDPTDGTSLAGRADRILDPGADDVAVTRSEERLVVRTDAVPVRRVRIRKVIVSEERTVTVTVRREELRVEEESLDGTDVVDPGTVLPIGSADAIELVLHEEQVEVVTRVVPVERVRVVTDVVTEQRSLTETVGHEEVDVVDEDLTDRH
ncbi:DUF2382 domain-containing protein [Curtobacterium sp. MCBD17_028]|uniref:DUF2382 domain-containing protein n=1 Tax=Curtobacterium sp. MCBD17_028 TaxID=2175670 RepID=UPI0015E899FF|nr:DUF2382 domain-containing protein [Curtobacterium sp. MCBD17_028]